MNQLYSLDLSRFNRGVIGLDRIRDMFARAQMVTDPGYPPYDIEQLSDDDYVIRMAVAGFQRDELSIELEGQTLTIQGTNNEVDESERTFVHKGIARRNFERKFELADHVKVNRTDLQDGLLTIHIVKVIPEALKPKRIDIGYVGTQATEPPKKKQTLMG